MDFSLIDFQNAFQTVTGALLLTLFERFGLIVSGAFILLTLGPVQKIGLRRDFPGRTAFLTVFFGLFGILGTYTGDTVQTSVANLRAMGVITGGLFGGPIVGLGAGVIAGAHRILIDIGGFSAIPCGIATAIEGLAAGLLAARLRSSGEDDVFPQSSAANARGWEPLDWRPAATLALAGETLHMTLVLAMSRPFEKAVALVEIIGMPMIIVNTIGSVLFVLVIRILFKHREKRDSINAQQILVIANQTVGHLRSGLTPESARETAKIIFDRVSVAAVSITDHEKVLAHVGAGNDHHLVGQSIQTQATRQVIETGKPTFIHDRKHIGCRHSGCVLNSAVVVPLFKGSGIVGTLKFYGTMDDPMDQVRFEIARGLAALFSTQLELEDIQLQSRMLAHAEIRRLQAQINPHFLFNSLNTIAAFTRVNATRARELILELARYMRMNLDSSRNFIRLSEELEQVRSYLAIEQARFGDRVNIEIDVEDGCGDWPIPPLIIQPLVENSVRHGILPREEGGTVTISASCEDSHLKVVVADDGVGMDEGQIASVLAENSLLESTKKGIGLANCNLRLKQIYSPKYSLVLESRPGEGTRTTFRVPQAPAVQ